MNTDICLLNYWVNIDLQSILTMVFQIDKIGGRKKKRVFAAININTIHAKA